MNLSGLSTYADSKFIDMDSGKNSNRLMKNQVGVWGAIAEVQKV